MLSVYQNYIVYCIWKSLLQKLDTRKDVSSFFLCRMFHWSLKSCRLVLGIGAVLAGMSQRCVREGGKSCVMWTIIYQCPSKSVPCIAYLYIFIHIYTRAVYKLFQYQSEALIFIYSLRSHMYTYAFAALYHCKNVDFVCK